MIAHPLADHDLLVNPLIVTVSVGAMIFAVALVREKPRRGDGPARHVAPSWDQPLTRVQVVTRACGLAVFGAVVAAGRLGTPDQLDNLAPALVVGLAWPMLAVAGFLWRFVDPWDSLGRLMERGTPGTPAGTVWPAVIPAALWMWYLTAYPRALEPDAVGAALALYTIATVAGCLVYGRVPWLSQFEIFGIFFGWTARLRLGWGDRWSPPAGAAPMLGVLAGGLAYGLLRPSHLRLGASARLHPTISVIVLMALGGIVVWLAARRAGDAVTAGALPAVVSLAVVLALARNRLFVSAQLLPRLLSDPLGRGWDPIGADGWSLKPWPLGVRGLVVLQLAVLVLGHLWGARLARRQAPRRRFHPTVVLLAMAVPATTAVAAT